MGKIRKKWSDAEVEKALSDVRSGKSVSGISKSSSIPKSTLIAKLKGHRPIGKKSGPSTILSTEEEAIIVRWMLHLSQRGFPVTKTQLFYNVAYLIKQLGRKTPFTDGRPGRHWYEAFLRRHPEISIRVAQNLPKSQASVTEDILYGWFKEVERHLAEKQLIDIDGARIFNCDESAFYLCPKGEHVLVRKGDKAVYNFTQNDEKECLTVLFMTNATGAFVSPMIVFRYKRIPYSVSQSVPIDWGIGKSENGWMTAETFYEYISNIFEPWLTAHNIKRPVILYVDGHSSHMTLPVAEFCMDHQIELIALYPNATHLIQPLDVALFRTLKSSWRHCVNDWRLQRNLRREDFGTILKIAIERIDFPRIMSNGFRKCGLFPFSADALQYNQLLQKKKNDTTPLTVTSEPKQNSENHLLFFESNIDENLLGEFRCANETGIYNGNVENLGLFFFWQQILKFSRGYFSIPNTKDSNSTDQIIDILVISDSNQSLDPNNSQTSTQSETCALNSSFDVAFDRINNSLYQGMEGKKNISPLKNSADNSTDESLFQEYPNLQLPENNSTDESLFQKYPNLQHADESIDVKANEDPNNLPQIIMEDEMIPIRPSQPNTDEDTTINETSDVNINATMCNLDTQPVSMSTIVNDNDCLNIPSDIPDVFKKTIFWPRKNDSTVKKRALKVKVPSVATSLAWQEYHRAKETEKSQRLIGIENRKRKRQETVEKKKQAIEEKKRQKSLQQAEKATQKNNKSSRRNRRGK